MSAESWVCKDEKQLAMCFEHLKKAWDWAKPLAIKWADGSMKTADQLALVHIWFREIANHLTAINKDGLVFNEDEVKVELKRQKGVILMAKDLTTGKNKPYLKSLGKYTKAEMRHFMNEVDVWAAERSCILSPGVAGYWYERQAA